jgi:hypothetical protein
MTIVLVGEDAPVVDREALRRVPPRWCTVIAIGRDNRP